MLAANKNARLHKSSCYLKILNYCTGCGKSRDSRADNSTSIFRTTLLATRTSVEFFNSNLKTLRQCSLWGNWRISLRMIFYGYLQYHKTTLNNSLSHWFSSLLFQVCRAQLFIWNWATFGVLSSTDSIPLYEKHSASDKEEFATTLIQTYNKISDWRVYITRFNTLNVKYEVS